MLSYKTFGTKNKQAILFLHGGFVSSWYWKLYIEVLSKDYYCITIDLPDHGTNINISLSNDTNLTAMIFDVLKNENIKILNVIGHSMGAKIGINLLEYQENVIIDKLIIFSAYYGESTDKNINQNAKIMHFLGKPLIRRMLAFFGKYPLKVRREYYSEAQFYDKLRCERILKYFFNQEYLIEKMQDIKTKIFAFYGENESKEMLQSMQNIKKNLNNCSLYKIRNGNHYSSLLLLHELLIIIKDILINNNFKSDLLIEEKTDA